MEGYFKTKDGIELYYKKDLAKSPKGVILINHGFAEHSGRYDYVAEKFNEGKYSVYRYDLRGHGKTKSPRGHIESYEEFIKDCDEMVELATRENKGLATFILGHSMGGMITCLYGIKYPEKLKGQIFSGPAVDTLPLAKGMRSKFLKALKLLAKTKTIKNVVGPDICSVEQVVIDYRKDPLILKEATISFYVEFLIEGIGYIGENIKNYKYPCFIAHGEKDKIVPKEIGKYLYENISSEDKKIKTYDDLYHEILNENEKDEILGDMIRWLDERV